MVVKFIKKHGIKKVILSINDVLCTLIAAFLALDITTIEGGISNTYFFDSAFLQKISIFFVGAISIVPIFRYYQLYKHKYFLKVGEQALLILKGLLIDNIGIILIIFLIKTQLALHESRSQVIIYFLFSFSLLLITRVLIFRSAFRGNYLGENIHRFLSRRALAVGAGSLGHFFAESIQLKQHYNIDLIGFLDDNLLKKDTRVLGKPVFGDISNLNNIVDDQEIDEIYITIQNIDNKSLMDLIERCKLTQCTINLVSNHFDIVNVKLDENEYHDLKIISVSSKISPLYSEKFKRIFDIIVSSIIMIVLIPSALIVALLIKITSRGSVFFKTTVIGKNGKPFYWYKFRTMYKDNDSAIHREHLKKLIIENHANQKIINDIRITKVGKFLRKFSLDEFPQLYNVFKGDMSLVGPRPCLPYEYEIFKEWHKLKYKVIPGMTGLAQIIARNRKDVTFNDSILLDLYYADNQSLWLDLKILFKTVPILLLGKGGI